MQKLINIDENFYKENKKQTTEWLCNIFEVDKETLNLDKQLSNWVYFTLLLINNIPASVCRFVIFDYRKTIYCSRQVLTKKEFRRKGYAEIVLNEGFKFLSENHNCKKMISYIDKDNKASLNLHKKIGYIKLEKVPKYYSQNRFAFDDCEILEKVFQK